jgi:methionine-rich copper-binding protein CopC
MMTRISMTTVADSFALICATTSAFAHAELEKATPAVGGAVSPPSEIRLTFGEAVRVSASKVTLSAAHGGAPSLGAPKAEDGNDAVLIVPIAKPLAPGVYSVHWHAVAADDGGKTQGSFTFTVK